MMLGFIPSFIEGNYEDLKKLSFVLIIFYGAVLAGIVIDLVTGVDRAKREGRPRCSDGYKRTIYKIKDYYTVLLLFTVVDVVASIWTALPYFTALATIAIILIEAKSVYENKKGLSKGVKDLPSTILQVLENRDKVTDLIKLIDENSKK